MTYFILHGTGGHSEENWFPWLKSELERNGEDVVVPDFPGVEDQSLTSWTNAFEEYEHLVDEHSVFIAHSVAPAFVMTLLERGFEARACFFVAGFTGLLGNEFDEPNKTITDKEFDFATIRSNCDYFKLYHAPDDPYVSLEKAERLAANLDAELDVVEGAGHFNESAGYTDFPVLLDDIDRLREEA